MKLILFHGIFIHFNTEPRYDGYLQPTVLVGNRYDVEPAFSYKQNRI